MSKTVDKLIFQCLRDIRLKKARRYRALLRHHQLFGLEHRAKLVVSSHAKNLHRWGTWATTRFIEKRNVPWRLFLAALSFEARRRSYCQF